MIITLIGFSGSGKSFYSKDLEQRLNWERIDCDTSILHALNIAEKNTVLDTSGSFVLLPEETILKFKKISKLIYLKYEEEDMELMIEQYFKEPKPVIWQHLYTPNEQEEFLESVKRCYVNLVNYRRKLYEKYADVTINISFKKRDDFDIGGLVESF